MPTPKCVPYCDELREVVPPGPDWGYVFVAASTLPENSGRKVSSTGSRTRLLLTTAARLSGRTSCSPRIKAGSA